MSKQPLSNRDRFKRRLVAHYFVRFHMSLILMATIGAGVLSSKFLLTLGLGSIMFRYALDVAAAYLAFLGLVRLWVWYVQSGRSSSAVEDGLDLMEANLELPSLDLPSGSASPSSSLSSVQSGGGGGSRSGGGSWLPDVGFDIDGEGCLILVVLAVLILAIVLAGGYLIYIAPEILGEAAFDAVVAGGLTGVVSRLERQGWLVGVVRGTILPFAVIFALTMGLAYTVQSVCPNAATLREGLFCPERK